MRELDGLVAAVTGVSAGIGEACARALVAHGMKVAGGARRTDRLGELQGELGESFVPVEMDVRQPEGGVRLVEAAVDQFGSIDVVIPNAGIGVYGGIMDQTDDEITAMVDTNVSGTIWPIRAAVPHMVKGGGGDIVIVASVAGLRGAGDEAVYAATKFAQVGLAGGLDRELREHGIRTTVVAPGGVATEFAMGTGRTPDMAGLSEMLRAEDVAQAVVSVLQQPRTMRTLLWSMRSIHEAD